MACIADASAGSNFPISPARANAFSKCRRLSSGSSLRQNERMSRAGAIAITPRTRGSMAAYWMATDAPTLAPNTYSGSAMSLSLKSSSTTCFWSCFSSAP